MKELLPNIYQAETIMKAGPVKVSSSMFVVKSGDDVILIDPFELDGSATEALEKLGKPTTILITGTMHVREAEAYRKRYGAKVLANRAAVPKLGIAVDDTFVDGDTVIGGMTAIEISGTMLGETIFRCPDDNGILITGDALMNIPTHERGFFLRLLGFSANLGPMPKLFMKDKKLAAESYRKLLDYEFDHIFVSHGVPISGGGKEQLTNVLNALKL